MNRSTKRSGVACDGLPAFVPFRRQLSIRRRPALPLTQPIQKMSSATVKTSLGSYRGNVHSSCREFLGIDYAVQPIGDLRFRAPRPFTTEKDKWDGERDATKKGSGH